MRALFNTSGLSIHFLVRFHYYFQFQVLGKKNFRWETATSYSGNHSTVLYCLHHHTTSKANKLISEAFSPLPALQNLQLKSKSLGSLMIATCRLKNSVPSQQVPKYNKILRCLYHKQVHRANRTLLDVQIYCPSAGHFNRIYYFQLS